MPDQENPSNDQKDSKAETPPTLGDRQPAPSCNLNPEPTKTGKHTSEKEKPPTCKALWREIRVIDLINCIVGIGTLLVAFAAYRVASDTRNLKLAVSNIAELATQTKRQADASLAQLQIMRNDQRAWIAPVHVSMVPPVKDAVIEMNVGFANTGKDAAPYSILSFTKIYSDDEWSNGSAFNELKSLGDKCSQIKDVNPKGIAYPTFGSNYNAKAVGNKSQKLEPVKVSDGIISGSDVATLSGCFVYKTEGTIHHTAFCNFFRNGETSSANLASCEAGNRTD